MNKDTGYKVMFSRSHKRKRYRSYVEDFYGVPGHIYVARNDAHRDGIYKIGLTTRSNPQVRINELNRQAHEARVTGHIGNLTLVCSFETIDCGRAESAVHAKLASYRYASNREFFELGIERIQATIESVLDDIERTVRTTGKTPQQLAYEENQQREAERQKRLAEDKKRREEEERRRQAEQELRALYAKKLAAQFPERPFWNYWLGGAAIVFVVLAMFGSEGFFASIFFGLFVGMWLSAHFDTKRRQSAGYKALEAERDRAIESVHAGGSLVTSLANAQSVASSPATRHNAPNTTATVDVQCPACLKELYIPAHLAQPGKIIRCPCCAVTFDYARTLALQTPVAPKPTPDLGKPLEIKTPAPAPTKKTSRERTDLQIVGVTLACFAVIVSVIVIVNGSDKAPVTKAPATTEPARVVVSVVTQEQQLQAIMDDAMRRWPYLNTPAGVEATREMIRVRDRWLELGLTPVQALRAAVEEVAPKYAK